MARTARGLQPSQRGQGVAVEGVGHESVAVRVVEHDAPPVQLVAQGDTQRLVVDAGAREQVGQRQAGLGDAPDG
jgi:hypothetical protein